MYLEGFFRQSRATNLRFQYLLHWQAVSAQTSLHTVTEEAGFGLTMVETQKTGFLAAH